MTFTVQELDLDRALHVLESAKKNIGYADVKLLRCRQGVGDRRRHAQPCG